MSESQTRDLLESCRKAGLDKETDDLSLLAIRQREAAIALAQATERFQEGRLAFVNLAKSRGIEIPSQISAETIANALA